MCKKLISLVPFFLIGLVLTCSAKADLVAWWKFDGNFEDSSGNNHHGTAVGTPTFAVGQYGQALSLSGSSQYLNCGQGITSATLGDGGTLTGYTMTFWVNRAAAGDHKVCGDIDNGGWTNGGGIKAAIYNNRLEVDMRDSDQRYFSREDATAPLGTQMTTNTWYHIAVVFDDAGNTMTIYLDGVVDRLLTVTQGMAASTHDWYIGADTPNAGRYFNGLIDDLRLYDSALSQADVLNVMAGRGPAQSTASSPVPADRATDVPRDVVLGWTPGPYAATHNVYFGETFDDVNDADATGPLGVPVSQGQDANSYDPIGVLQFGQTYYWRVDEVNAPPTSHTVFKGDVWSFTVEPFAYPITNVTVSSSIPTAAGAGGPEKTVDGSGLSPDGQHSTAGTDMWQGDISAGGPIWIQYDFDTVYKIDAMRLWNYNIPYEPLIGFGVKDITLEYATDANDWITLGDYEVLRAPGQASYTGMPIDLGGVAARSVRINMHSNWGTQEAYGFSEVRFLYIPVCAREPKPASGATGVAINAALDWRAGREAALHEVYFGTDEQAVVNGTAVVDAVAESTYSPGPLRLGTTYYWKINEVNEVLTPSVWESDVWSFSTKEYIAIDDFESYTDDQGSEIFATWLDGYDLTTNGSQVGHENPPYAEKTVARRGQSMPFYYTNTGGIINSEAERTFAPAQDWTTNGADTLSIYHRGIPTGFVVRSESNILMNGIGADIWNTADQFRFVYKRLSGNGSITARVDSLVNTHQWAKAGVMIRESLDAGSAYALNLVSPTNGISFQYRSATNGNAATVGTQGGLAAPYWVRITRQGNTFTAEHSDDGVTWTPVTATASTVDITMATDVYVGLAVCSVSSTIPTGAEFSGITGAGAISGQWQSAGIGAEQPAGNGIDTFYIAVEDSSGKKATVSHPDPTVLGMGMWRQWRIPLSDLAAAGVKVNSIKKFYIGIGDKSKPSQNAAGLLYIDDIAFGHPIATP
jgi:regulation of enolase protein 1 (concanavalin A-like superfamily)